MPIPEPPTKLTRRHKQVLTLLARGETTKGIGFALGIAPKTATRHREDLMARLRVNCSTSAVVTALKRGDLHLEDI
jgi:DNA-binding NarL/FixJ family response regulator